MFSRRRALLSAAALLAAPSLVHARQKGDVQLGFISSSTTSPSSPLISALREGLTDLGYVEGKNLSIVYKFAQSRDQLPAMAEDLVRQRVDVILAGGSEGIVAAQKATTTIPIVMTNSGDAVREGFAASFSRPGGNITGLTQLSPDIAGKRLEIATEMLPGLARIGVFWNPIHPNTPITFEETAAAAKKLGLRVTSIEVKDADEFSAGLASLGRERVQALAVLRDPLMVRNHAVLAQAAIKLRMPTIHETSDFVQAGGLMYYGADFAGLFRLSASYVDKLVKGARAGDLPIGRPTKFELGLNLKTAAAIGLRIPISVQTRADKVIE